MAAKRIEIEELGELKFRIVKQTHRGEEFGRGSRLFLSSCGFLLESKNVPDVMADERKLWVRGVKTEEDERVMYAPSEEWMQLLRAAVREYNSTFSRSGVVTLVLGASAVTTALLIWPALREHFLRP